VRAFRTCAGRRAGSAGTGFVISVSPEVVEVFSLYLRVWLLCS